MAGDVTPSDWLVEHRRGSAGELHGLDVPADGRRRVWVFEPVGPALVLGSTQRDVVDRPAAAARGIEVVHRRSGGGAVFVAPGDPLWIDVFVPRGDPLWDDDVGCAFLPIGRAWATALESLGVGELTVHPGGLVTTEWSRLVCFAGVGPGEVLADDRKLVGISQRRSRAGARFQCAIHRRWDPAAWQDLLRPAPPTGTLDAVAVGAPSIDPDDVVAALVDALSRPA